MSTPATLARTPDAVNLPSETVWPSGPRRRPWLQACKRAGSKPAAVMLSGLQGAPRNMSYVQLPTKTVWPSGLRRWLQAPVRKGVGSNPTALNAHGFTPHVASAGIEPGNGGRRARLVLRSGPRDLEPKCLRFAKPPFWDQASHVSQGGLNPQALTAPTLPPPSACNRETCTRCFTSQDSLAEWSKVLALWARAAHLQFRRNVGSTPSRLTHLQLPI